MALSFRNLPDVGEGVHQFSNMSRRKFNACFAARGNWMAVWAAKVNRSVATRSPLVAAISTSGRGEFDSLTLAKASPQLAPHCTRVCSASSAAVRGASAESSESEAASCEGVGGRKVLPPEKCNPAGSAAKRHCPRIQPVTASSTATDSPRFVSRSITTSSSVIPSSPKMRLPRHS